MVNQKDLSVDELAALADMISLSQASVQYLLAEVDAEVVYLQRSMCSNLDTSEEGRPFGYLCIKFYTMKYTSLNELNFTFQSGFSWKFPSFQPECFSGKCV